MNDKVKDAIGFMHDYARKTANGGMIGIAIDEAKNDITSYIEELEEKIKCDRLTVLYTNKLQNRVYEQKSKLDKIKYVVDEKVFGIGNDRWVVDVNKIDEILKEETK